MRADYRQVATVGHLVETRHVGVHVVAKVAIDAEIICTHVTIPLALLLAGRGRG